MKAKKTKTKRYKVVIEDFRFTYKAKVYEAKSVEAAIKAATKDRDNWNDWDEDGEGAEPYQEI